MSPDSPLSKPGLLLWSDLEPRRLIELVEQADASGYSEFWLTDVRFQYDCYIGLALAAHHSKHMLVGPGVSDPYSRHPAVIAMAMATLDTLSDGRAQVGLGTGSGGIKEMHLPQEKPVRALREAIELMREMFTGETVNFTGELYHLEGAGLGFKPVRQSIPVFVATHSPQVLRLSGSLCDGILLANMARREALVNAVSILREGEQAAGRQAGSVAVHLRLEACISDDEASALAVLRKRMAVRLGNSYPRWAYLEELGISPTEAMKEAAAVKDTAALAALLSDDDVRSSTLVGSAQSAAAQLLAILTPDVTKVTIRPLDFAGQGLDVTIAKFVEEVWPAVETGLAGKALSGS